MKPIFRWTIGNVTQTGIDMLATSLTFLRSFYDFDCWICHNNLNNEQLTQIQSLNANLHQQQENSLPIKPKGVAWKLYPPRIDINRHEIFIDNDLVIFKKMPKIDEFLNSDKVIYTKSLFHAFGRYKPLIPANFRLNSGFFGIPPDFDFEKEILLNIKESWVDPFDEQGLVAMILKDHPKIEIELDEVQICHEGSFGKPKYGYHFVHANTGDLRAWNKFKK